MAVESSTHLLASVAGITAGIFLLRTYDQWCIESSQTASPRVIRMMGSDGPGGSSYLGSCSG